MEEYLVPTGFGEDEFVEKKSRFLGRVWPADTEAEALAHIEEMRKQHYDATHNCWAYIIRDGATRFSDDGEPGGTAGMPMVQVLGAGGLVRAYTKGAKIAVDAAGKSMKRVWTALYIPCPYPYYERLKLLCEDMEAVIRDTQFTAEVELEVLVAAGKCAEFQEKLTDMTAGTVETMALGQEYRAFPVKDAKGSEQP